MGGSEVNNCSHLQAEAPCYIHGWCRMQAVSQPLDASLQAEGKRWDGASSCAGMGAGKLAGEHFVEGESPVKRSILSERKHLAEE